MLYVRYVLIDFLFSKDLDKLQTLSRSYICIGGEIGRSNENKYVYLKVSAPNNFTMYRNAMQCSTLIKANDLNLLGWFGVTIRPNGEHNSYCLSSSMGSSHVTFLIFYNGRLVV